MKFAQMATKKLQKLVADPATPDEDKVAIQAIIDKRQAATEVPATESAELSPEEQAAINAAETAVEKAITPVNPEEAEAKKKAKAGRKSTTKLTAEELDDEYAKLVTEAKGHRCETTMPGTMIKIDGYIKSVLKEKRAMRCYLLIQADVTEDNPTGKQFYKVAAEVTVLEETVELRKKSTTRARAEKLDDEEWAAKADKVTEAAGVYVGRKLNLDEDRGVGIIETIVRDKRAQSIFFRVGFEDENGTHKCTHRAIHFTFDAAENDKVVIEEPTGLLEADEAYSEWQNKWQTRAERQPRTVVTPEERVVRAEAALEKAKKALEKAQEALQCKQLEYDNAKSALDAKHDAQEAQVEAAEENKEAAQDTCDLM